jgi:hypothetical protein
MTIVVRGSLLPVAPEASDSEAYLRPVRPEQWDRIRETPAIAWFAVRPACSADQRPPFNIDLEQRLKSFSAGADPVTNLPMTKKVCRKSGAIAALLCDIPYVRPERYDGRTSREAVSLINRLP